MRLIRAAFDRKRRYAGLWFGPLYVGLLLYGGPAWGRFFNVRPFVLRWGPLVVTWHESRTRR